jgi:hypothetical protein
MSRSSLISRRAALGGACTTGLTAFLVQWPINLSDELYFEEGELRVPHTFDDTDAEIAAGMP